MKHLYFFLKRLIDIIAFLFVFFFLGWFLLLMIIISSIIHNSFGIFTQHRIGKNEKPFNIYKIKTMKNISGFNGNTTLKNDPRVTLFGNFLRKYKIDEFLQIFNLLNGSMTCVGPRPTVREDYERMSEQQRKRFEVKPGLTGLAQISGNTNISWPERIKLDIEYIDKMSFRLDFMIVMKTIYYILFSKIETHPQTDDEWKE